MMLVLGLEGAKGFAVSPGIEIPQGDIKITFTCWEDSEGKIYLDNLHVQADNPAPTQYDCPELMDFFYTIRDMAEEMNSREEEEEESSSSSSSEEESSSDDYSSENDSDSSEEDVPKKRRGRKPKKEVVKKYVNLEEKGVKKQRAFEKVKAFFEEEFAGEHPSYAYELPQRKPAVKKKKRKIKKKEKE
jgi:hypothetical protein